MSSPTAFAVTRATVLRMLRDRTALFFMVLLPVAITVAIGAVASGIDEFRVGVVAAGPVPAPSRASRRPNSTGRTGSRRSRTRESTARTSVRRAEVDAVVLVPADLEADIRADRDHFGSAASLTALRVARSTMPTPPETSVQ
ncbi:hypothetical protein ACFYO0_40735 [Streptomyces sp. NPDC006365]|uniref:hypothetical protein n=1 Tax=Streptomyces sp. NPDC006365 TaxID=3364744 RepID=UPI00368FD90A